MKQSRFVVLDRDGTIIVERHYLSDLSKVELLPDATSGLRQMRKQGLGLVVITNQSAIGRGMIDRACLDLIHKRMCKLLEKEGVYLDGIYFCPHLPEDNCSCRKPGTALFRLAAKELNFKPQHSFVVGDKACDVGLGQRLGAITFLVRTGYGEQFATKETIRPDFVVDNLHEVATVIEHLLHQNKREIANENGC